MGQTLQNGIYLPAEGERNCYDGLEGNWRSLDSLISTVAGKASATHTHGNITNDGKIGSTANLPLITGTGGVVQAGSFGTSANTFCEGNDSRLSDARTPVAHTHGKSDITDLLNSNFIPSANNSYDLGSSSYQWNNLYAKNYFYNGTAWGLDKANVWSADQATTGNLFIKSTTLQKGVIPSSNTHKNLYFSDKNGANIGVIRLRLSTGGSGSFRIYGSTLVKDGQIDPTGAEFNWGFGQYLNPDGTTYFSFDGNIANNVIPTSSNYDLGTSTNKWKTLNGINPGALSLPDYAKSANIDTTNWNTTGTKIDYTPPENCLIQIVTHNESGNKITVLNKYTSPEWGSCVCGNGQGTNLFFEKLLEGGRTYYIYITDTNASPTVRARYVPLFGNV